MIAARQYLPIDSPTLFIEFHLISDSLYQQMRQHSWTANFKLAKISLHESHFVARTPFRELLSRLLEVLEDIEDTSTKYIIVNLADTRKIRQLLQAVRYFSQRETIIFTSIVHNRPPKRTSWALILPGL